MFTINFRDNDKISKLNGNLFFQNKNINSIDLQDKVNGFKFNEISKIELIQKLKVDQFLEAEVNENMVIDENEKDNMDFQVSKRTEKFFTDDKDHSLKLNEKINNYLKSDVGFFKSPKIEKYDKITQYYDEMKNTIFVPEEVEDNEENEFAINNKEYDTILDKEHSK